MAPGDWGPVLEVACLPALPVGAVPAGAGLLLRGSWSRVLIRTEWPRSLAARELTQATLWYGLRFLCSVRL